jgi:hypothetical protein
MAFSVLGNVAAQSTNGTSVTTAGLNTNGADLLIVVLSCELLGTGSTITDSQSNVWTPLAKYNNGARAVRAFICLGPTTNASHTFSFTVSGSETTPSLGVLAVSGAQQTSQPDKSATSSNNQLPSTTPSANNELVISYISTINTPPLTPAPTGYTTPILLNSTSNANGIGLGYLIQTTATATAPLWNANDSARVTGLNSFFNSTAQNIAVPKVTLAITAYIPAVKLSIPVPVATLAITTHAPTLGQVSTIEIPAGAMSLTGYAPTVTITTPDIDIAVPMVQVVLTEYAPVVSPIFIPIPAQTLTITTYVPALNGTRAVEVPTGSLVLATFAPTVFLGDIGACSERFGPKLYYWEPSYLIRPEDTFLRATDWDNCDYQGMKFIQGLIIEADTEGQTRQVLVQGDQSDVETLTINHNGQLEKPYSLNQPVQKHLMRLLPTDLTSHWRLFNVRWVYEPAPEFAREWKTQGTDHDIPGYQFLKDGYIAHNSTADITLNILVDDQLFTYTIPNSGGVYVKTYILFSILNSGRALKGSLFTYELTSANPFQLFQKDSEVRVHAWAGGGYEVKLPFGDISRKAGARI